MKTPDYIYQDFKLFIIKIHTKNAVPHQHHYFEMIYVLEGNGMHIINDSQYDYAKGDLFLLNTQDFHTFKTTAPTELCIIDFTSSFFSFIRNERNDYRSADFFEQMEYVFHNQYRLKGNVITKENDKKWVHVLIKRLLWENEQHTTNVCKNIVFLLLQLISGYIQEQPVFPLKTQRANKMIREITNYIHQYISDKVSLRIENIARHFYKTKDYISLYFRKQTGFTLKDYILSYKIELAKTRLLYSNLTIATIASELNFTDESHLNKLFIKKVGMTANTYRKNVKE